MTAREAIIALGDVPTLRVVRDDRNGIAVHCAAAEWPHANEAADFAAWLEPVVEIFIDHDQIARATGQPVLAVEDMAGHLADTARTLLAPAYLTKHGKRWRFRGGRPPADSETPRSDAR